MSKLNTEKCMRQNKRTVSQFDFMLDKSVSAKQDIFTKEDQILEWKGGY